MAKIALEGMRFYAHHGHYKEEKLCGGEYEVDVYLDVRIDKAAVQDKLEFTLNYETIYLICRTAMKQRAKLIETVAERIALGLKNQFGFIREMNIRVRKLNPPLGGPVRAAVVEVDGQFSKKCARCGKPMLCYGDKSCWCMDVPAFDGTLEFLKSEFGNDCLCKECIVFYTGAEIK